MPDVQTSFTGNIPLWAEEPVSTKKIVEGHFATEGDKKPPPSKQAAPDEILSLRAERDELTRRIALLPRNLQHVAARLSESQKALDSIRRARDAVMARSTELSDKLRAAQERIDELTDSQELAEFERTAAIERLQAAQRECADLREKLEEAPREGAESTSPQEGSSVESAAKIRSLIAAVEMREDQAKEKQRQSIAKLVEQFSDERREWRRQLEETQTKADVQISALQAQLAAHTKNSVPMAEVERYREVIGHLQAELDFLRNDSQQPQTSESTPEDETLPTTALAAAPEALGAIDPREVESQTAPMQWFLLELEKDSSRLDTLDVLASLFQDTAQRALGVGCIATNRLASACTHVTTWLRKTPKRISANLPALHEGRNLIGKLLQRQGIARVSDPSGAVVYAVDNDVDNCECLARKLEKMGLHARYTLKAEMALGELTDGSCDLIILDGDLGNSDGLHGRIREIDHHRETPILLMRSPANPRDGWEDISDSLTFSLEKPYHLHELTLRALCAILAARVEQA